MNFGILPVDALPRDQWDDLTDNSFLSSPDFASIWRVFGGEPAFFIAEENRILLAGLAGVTFGPRYLKRFKSMPNSLYGGPFFSPDLGNHAREEFLRLFLVYLHAHRFIRVDIHNSPDELESDWLVKNPLTTHIIRLDGNKYSPPDPNVLSDLRRAQKENLKVSILNDESYLDDFHRLVIETCRRLNIKSRYPKEFYRELLNLSQKDNRIIWPMVQYEGKIIASHIRFIERSQILCWQNYWDRNYRHLNPNHLLFDYIIKYAQQNQIPEINLGGSPPGADSLVRFKEAWGGKKEPVSHYFATFGLGKLIYGLGLR